MLPEMIGALFGLVSCGFPATVEEKLHVNRVELTQFFVGSIQNSNSNLGLHTQKLITQKLITECFGEVSVCEAKLGCEWRDSWSKFMGVCL